MWAMRLLKLGIGFPLGRWVLYLAENSNNGKIKLISEKLMQYTDSIKCCAAAKLSLLLVCGAKVSNH